MRWRLAAVAVALVAAGVWWLRPEPGPPNVVLIVGCTVRRDQVSIHGGPDTTPFLAEVARRGTVFDDAIAAAPWTKAALTALFTGRHPTDVGMTELGPGRNSRTLAAEATTLAERFTDAGYTTVGGTANPNANAVFGLSQGMRTWFESTGLWREGGVAKVPGTVLGDAILADLDALDPSGPVFVQAVLVDAHQPYPDDPAEAAPFALGVPMRVAHYRVGLRQLDAAVAHLVDGLAERGITEANTVFVVVSDHGEGLFWPEQHGRGHGNYTNISTTGMVWVMWGHGVARGHRVAGMASQIDVYPTVLSTVGLADGGLGAQVAGAPHTGRTEAFTDTWFLASQGAGVFTDAMSCHLRFAMGGAAGTAPDPPSGCFDRGRDPGEAGPIGPLDPELEGRLRAWREARFAAAQAWPYTADIDVEADLGSQLEALGYVQGSED